MEFAEVTEVYSVWSQIHKVTAEFRQSQIVTPVAAISIAPILRQS